MGYILVVHDHAGLRDLLARNVEPYWQVECVIDGDAAVSAARLRRPDLILAGASGPENNARQLLHTLEHAASTQDIPLLLIVGHAAMPRPGDHGSDLVALLHTPFTAQELVGRIDAQLKLAHLQHANAQREAALKDQVVTAQGLLEHVLTSRNDHFVMFDAEWRYIYVSEAAAKVLGLPREELLGNRIWDLFPEAIGNQFYREVHHARAEGCDVRFEHYEAPWDRWYDNRVYVLQHGVSVLSIDITERKHAEATPSQWRQLS
jgi:PAS domain S-box-containing protein